MWAYPEIRFLGDSVGYQRAASQTGWRFAFRSARRLWRS